MFEEIHGPSEEIDGGVFVGRGGEFGVFMELGDELSWGGLFEEVDELFVGEFEVFGNGCELGGFLGGVGARVGHW